MVHKPPRSSPGIGHLVLTEVANFITRPGTPAPHFPEKPPTSLRLYLWESPADPGPSGEHPAGPPPRQGIQEGLPKRVSIKLSSEAGVRVVLEMRYSQ